MGREDCQKLAGFRDRSAGRREDYTALQKIIKLGLVKGDSNKSTKRRKIKGAGVMPHPFQHKNIQYSPGETYDRKWKNERRRGEKTDDNDWDRERKSLRERGECENEGK